MWRNSSLNFDPHQFAGRRFRAVEAHATRDGWESTGISFSDYQSGMHTHGRKTQRQRKLETPSWARNTSELRETILRFCERRLYLRTHGKLTEQSELTYEQRLANIREAELQMAKKKFEPALRRLIERQVTDKSPKLQIQVQNIDSQIQLCRRGNAAIAARIVQLYHGCGYTSVEVAEEMRLHPPLVRQTLARLDQAARGFHYVCPKHQKAREFRLQVKRIKKLFQGVQYAVACHEKGHDASSEQLRAIMDKGKKNKAAQWRGRWSRDKFFFVMFLDLKGVPWDSIAAKIGHKHGHNVRAMF